jgi:ferredoxin
MIDGIKRRKNKMNEEELKKGCGKTEYYGNEHVSDTYVCGMGWYCKECQAKLLQRQEDVKEFEKKIDEWFKHLKGNSVYLKQIEELKASLKTSEEKQDDQ